MANLGCRRGIRSTLWALGFGATLLTSEAPGNAAEATLRPETERAWAAYVAGTEARTETELSSPQGFLAMDFAPGAATERAAALAGATPIAEIPVSSEVPAGTITHWRGAVFVPGVTLENVLSRAQHPLEHGPFQSDVLAMRVLERRPDALRLFIKMTRQAIVTVTYNTEHDVTYRRHGPARASSRSIATKISEVDRTDDGDRERASGDDHGFLWRLNSYWRYEQLRGGVLVELQSLSLSRGIPLGLGLISRPLITRIARESIERTLIAFRQDQLRAIEPPTR